MAKGYQTNQERKMTLSSFGKDLARRARSKCELCESAGVPLSVFEVPPEPTEAVDIDQCIFICDNCREQSENLKKFKPGEHWRVLAQTVWSETAPIQVMATRLLKRQADSQAWARETLEGLFLDEEIEEWVTKAE